MTVDPNVVNQGQSPTTPANNSPLPSGSPATPASATPAVIPGAQAPANGVGVKPPEGFVPKDALHEEREKRQAAQTQLAQLQALFGDKFKIENGQVVPITPQAPAAQNQPVMDEGQVRAQMDKMWEEDPRKAVNTEILMALSFYDEVNSVLDIQKESVRGKYADFTQMETEVNKYLKRLPFTQRGQPGAVETAYLLVKGMKAGDIAEAARKAAYDEAVAKLAAGQGAGGGMPAGYTPAAGGGAKPSEDQAKVAAVMGMTLEEYMKHVK